MASYGGRVAMPTTATIRSEPRCPFHACKFHRATVQGVEETWNEHAPSCPYAGIPIPTSSLPGYTPLREPPCTTPGCLPRYDNFQGIQETWNDHVQSCPNAKRPGARLR